MFMLTQHYAVACICMRLMTTEVESCSATCFSFFFRTWTRKEKPCCLLLFVATYMNIFQKKVSLKVTTEERRESQRDCVRVRKSGKEIQYSVKLITFSHRFYVTFCCNCCMLLLLSNWEKSVCFCLHQSYEFTWVSVVWTEILWNYIVNSIWIRCYYKISPAIRWIHSVLYSTLLYSALLYSVADIKIGKNVFNLPN